MNVMFDINVVLDIVGKREPFFSASRDEYLRVVENGAEPMLSAHAYPTIFYVLGAAATRHQRKVAMNWIRESFSVASVGSTEISAAYESKLSDFEDAIVVASAQSAGCAVIVTRNVRDFAGAPVKVVSPEIRY